MKRIASPEWEAARLFADRVLEALDPLASKADARLPFEEWTAAHLAALDRLADLGFSTESADEEERSTLEAAASVSNPALTFALAD